MTVEARTEPPAAAPSWARPPAAEVTPTHPALAIGIPLVIAAVFWLLDRRTLAVIVVGLATLVMGASRLSPSFARIVHRIVTAVGRAVGSVLTILLLGGMWLLVFVPVGLVMKLLRVDPLESPGLVPGTRWQRHVDSAPRLYRHQFARERAPVREATTRWGRIRHAVAVVIVALVVFAAVDLGVGVGWDRVDPQDATRKPAWEKAAAHADDSWAAEYYAAVRRRRFEYDPARAFIPTDVSSPYLNVEGGIRRSYRPAAASGTGTVRIFFFGGSVLWGLGQRDDHTIPSEIARRAEAENLNVEVTNYGQSAYSLWQEVRLFEELLASGQVPDIAVFLDGYNDTVARYDWPGTGRDPTTLEGDFRELLARGEAHRRAERGPAGAVRGAIELYANHSATGRIWQALFGAPQYRPKKPSTPSPAEIAEQVAVSYERSVDVARRLGASYGVDTFFFWQPTVVDKPEVAQGEQFVTGSKWTGFASVWSEVTPQVTDVAIDLTGVYDGHPEALFTDIVHTNERGAALIAERIWEWIEGPVRAAAANAIAGTRAGEG